MSLRHQGTGDSTSTSNIYRLSEPAKIRSRDGQSSRTVGVQPVPDGCGGDAARPSPGCGAPRCCSQWGRTTKRPRPERAARALGTRVTARLAFLSKINI